MDEAGREKDGPAGVPLGPQISKLNRGCDVVVGTPGRIIDLIENSGALNLAQVSKLLFGKLLPIRRCPTGTQATACIDKGHTQSLRVHCWMFAEQGLCHAVQTVARSLNSVNAGTDSVCDSGRG